MIRITVPGRPVPKGRPRLGVRGKKAFVYTPERTKAYEEAVGWHARAAVQGDALDCPVAVVIDLYLYGKQRLDVDNCAKSILDGMNGIVYEDDNQVVDLRVRKKTPSGAVVILVNCILPQPEEGGKRMKLKRATYRHIEAEIHSYWDTVKAIEELRKDIILASRQEINYPAAVGGRYAGTSIVERRATKLADSVLLREMERITKAIEDTYAQAKEEGRRVVWVKYGLALEGWQPPAHIAVQMEGRNRFDMSVREMAEILAVDESTFHRYRTGFVYGVAEKLGWY